MVMKAFSTMDLQNLLEMLQGYKLPLELVPKMIYSYFGGFCLSANLETLLIISIDINP